MNWTSHLLDQSAQVALIKNRDQKQSVADKIADRVRNGDVIGVGSGSTSLLAVYSIAKKVADKNLSIKVIPTSLEMKFACQNLNLLITDLTVDKVDWCLDGADEVDSEYNLNKGRGGALFKEKLVMMSCNERYILVDPSKLVPVIGTNFPIPVEIYPMALRYVESELIKLGSTEMSMRLAGGKDGPVLTESGCLILDVYFEKIYTGLEKEIKSITGVLESGLFQGYNPILITS
ncbi:MAG: ribose 5-phosphate isomerase A [Pedobacter sp.]